MNVTLTDIQKEYFSDSNIIEVNDKQEIQRLMESKMSCTWFCGQPLEDEWIFLFQTSPIQPGDMVTW